MEEKMTCFSRLFAILGLIAVLATPAHAAGILISNLAEPERDFNTLDGLLWAAQSFEADASGYALTNILAIVGGESGSSGAFAQLRGATATGEMDTSASGLLTTFSVPALDGPRSARTFTPTSSLILSPLTRYYFTLGATGPGSFEWSYAEGNGSVGPGTFGPYQYTFDGGATWGIFGTDNPFHLQVDVAPTAVPETSTAVLLLSGLVAMVVLKRGRRPSTAVR
jgi:hypothetical protein